MFPPAFDYRAPASLDEALAILAEQGDDAKLMAGGQSLIPLLKLRFASPAVLVDLSHVPGMAGVEEVDGELRIGARTRHVDVERDHGLRRRWRILADTAPLIADPLVRNLGTVGGSLCHADPAGDWGSVMLALDATLVARSRSGERRVRAVELFDGPYTTTLRPDEVVTQIRVPAPAGAAGGTYLKLERKVGDFATVGVAVQVVLSNGTVKRAGIGLTAVGPTNLKATAAEQSLAGRELTEEAVKEAARLAAEAAEPRDDLRGTAAYKKDIVRVFVQRGLRAAAAAAREATA
jgi:carbon-monoxide dehydrogenase medium subunit